MTDDVERTRSFEQVRSQRERDREQLEERIRRAKTLNPEMNLNELAERFGCSPRRVRAVLDAAVEGAAA